MSDAPRMNVRKFVPVTVKQLKRHRMIDNTVVIDGMEVTHAIVVGMFIAGETLDSHSTCSLDDSTGVVHDLTYTHNQSYDSYPDKYVRAIINFQPNSQDPTRATFNLFSCIPIADSNEIYHHLLLAYQTAATMKNPHLFQTAAPALNNFASTNTAFNAPVSSGSVHSGELDGIPADVQYNIKETAAENPRLVPVLSAAYRLQISNPNGFSKDQLYNKITPGSFDSRASFEHYFSRLLDEGQFYSSGDDVHFKSITF